jgi:hypothetical protein
MNLWATTVVLAQFAVDQRTARFRFTIPLFEWALIFFFQEKVTNT